MRSLVDDLLDISRVNSGKVRLEIRALDLVDVLAEAAAAAQGAMQAHEHRFETQLPPGPVRVQADRTRLQQVFGNLLGNAAKYTPRGGHVALRARVEGDEAVVDVQDDGMGIPPAALARIFQMFEQVDSHLQHSQGGLGIGLALVHRLVALHGGRVEARSDGEGRGTTFTVHLPLGPSPQP
jgi:signal transduction histidine kinase